MRFPASPECVRTGVLVAAAIAAAGCAASRHAVAERRPLHRPTYARQLAKLSPEVYRVRPRPDAAVETAIRLYAQKGNVTAAARIAAAQEAAKTN